MTRLTGTKTLALAAVEKWKWEPTYVGCEAVPVIVTATVNFVIR